MQLGLLDRLKTPQTQGIAQILKKYSRKEHDSFRESLKEASFSELKAAGAQYLVNSKRSRCIFGKDCPSEFTE